MAKATKQQKEMHSFKHDNVLDMDIIVPYEESLKKHCTLLHNYLS